MMTRRTTLRLLYESTDISTDIAGDFVSFEWTDNESGKADDINLTLKDESGKWVGPWFPGKGDVLRATILDEQDTGVVDALFCGRFTIDDLKSSGPPAVFSIKGVSIPLNKALRREARSKAWEDVKLSKIVATIAEGGELTSFYDVDADPKYDRIDQQEESDLAFLKRICTAEGYSLKVTDNQLVVFEQSKYEQRQTIGSLVKGSDDIISWDFESQAFDLYKECTVAYLDPETEEYLERTFKDPNVKDGMKYKLTKRAPSLAEAERLAKNKLRSLNKHEVTANFTVKGTTRFVSGVTLQVVGFGKYDGKYLIEEATHSVSGGYTCRLKMRRVLEGY